MCMMYCEAPLQGHPKYPGILGKVVVVLEIACCLHGLGEREGYALAIQRQ